jgi:hypothetical protein
MAHDRLILPSDYPSQDLSQSLDIKPRQPLLDSTGNAQYHTLASSNIYHGHKGLQPRLEHPPPKFTLPCLPSQPAPRTLGMTRDLHQRRSSTRNHRSVRSAARCRNPIAQSPQYRAYRERQPKNSADDQKWPNDLEDAFLDGMQSLLESLG